jgi:hypothetical protein
VGVIEVLGGMVLAVSLVFIIVVGIMATACIGPFDRGKDC